MRGPEQRSVAAHGDDEVDLPLGRSAHLMDEGCVAAKPLERRARLPHRGKMRFVRGKQVFDRAILFPEELSETRTRLPPIALISRPLVDDEDVGPCGGHGSGSARGADGEGQDGCEIGATILSDDKERIHPEAKRDDFIDTIFDSGSDSEKTANGESIAQRERCEASARAEPPEDASLA